MPSIVYGDKASQAILFGLVQYNRAIQATDSAREFVERRHVGCVRLFVSLRGPHPLMTCRPRSASQALAEARHEAKLYGRERREQIRRIVRSMEVERDYEERMARAEAQAEAAGRGGGEGRAAAESPSPTG